MKKLLLLTTLLIFFSLNLVAQSEEDKIFEESVFEMFSLSGTEETFQTTIQQMATLLEPLGGSEEFLNAFLDASILDVQKRLVPVYKNHFTLEDIQQLIAFYKTPIGQKLAQKTPLITGESMQVGQQWGMELYQEYQDKLKNEGK